MNNVCILARAMGGQMQSAATQAMRCHRRGAATPQMPAVAPLRAAVRRPAGFGARSLHAVWHARRSRLAGGRGDQQEHAKRYSLTGPKEAER